MAEQSTHPGSEAVLVLQQRMEKSWRGIIQVQGLAEVREFLRAQRAGAAGIKTVKNFFQTLLALVLLLDVTHPTGQHPALKEKEGKKSLFYHSFHHIYADVSIQGDTPER